MDGATTGAPGVVCCIHPAVRMTAIRKKIRNFPALFSILWYPQ
jgi:hypothetical protein